MRRCILEVPIEIIRPVELPTCQLLKRLPTLIQGRQDHNPSTPTFFETNLLRFEVWAKALQIGRAHV